MDPTALVTTAAARFLDGADDAFAECFSHDVTIYGEPAVSARPLVTSRAELEALLARTRSTGRPLSVTVGEVVEHGHGAVCETIVVRDHDESEVWRVALGVLVRKDEICEVRAFWRREAAERWVAEVECPP